MVRRTVVEGSTDGEPVLVVGEDHFALDGVDINVLPLHHYNYYYVISPTIRLSRITPIIHYITILSK